MLAYNFDTNSNINFSNFEYDLGGVGFIVRYKVSQLVDNNICIFISNLINIMIF